MKILPVSSYRQSFSINNNNKNNKNAHQLNQKQISTIGVYPLAYVSFAGGFSVNLAQTVKKFAEAETEKGKSVAPSRVLVLADEILDLGNPDDLTLIDVHKEAYKYIKIADSVDEIKESYPEFEAVLSDSEVDFGDNKFVKEVKEGKHSIFNQSEDLSLQLMKLYWADGFSLGDIASHVGTHKAAIAEVMEKLRIPRVTNRYGVVLKLSDKEYNSRLSLAMADKMAEIHAIKNGLPLIPRKVTPEQKEKISQGLIAYYANHPERMSEMSERQKEFYKTHPEAALVFRLVMIKAWHMESCDVVRRKLGEFLSSKHTSIEETIPTDAMYFSNKQKALMKMFWEQNPYLKKKFSKAVEQANKKINNYKNIEVIKNTADISPFPRPLQEKIYSWAKNEGLLRTGSYNMTVGLHLAPYDVTNRTKEQFITNEFFKYNRKDFSDFNNAMAAHVIGIYTYFKHSDNKDPLAERITTQVEKFMQQPQRSVSEMIWLYGTILTKIKSANRPDLVQRFVDTYDTTYFNILNGMTPQTRR